jgi:hypothetical protein
MLKIRQVLEKHRKYNSEGLKVTDIRASLSRTLIVAKMLKGEEEDKRSTKGGCDVRRRRPR